MTDNPYAAATAQPGPHPTARSVRRRWLRASFRLLIIHTALILTFMPALLAGWTDFGPIPFDCVYPPYLFISGPIVHVAAHAVQHAFDPLLSPDDVASVRLAWNLIPGSVCLVLGGFQ